MDISKIIEAIQSKRINVTYHAREEAKNDALLLDEILFSTFHGEIIEDYPKDKPYPACLVYGESPNGDPIHSVWAYDSKSKIAILITVYRPDPNLWINWKKRK